MIAAWGFEKEIEHIRRRRRCPLSLLLPLLWTATSYGLMGVANPTLEHRVNWPWFIVSQFVFGLATALLVVRSEKIPIEPVRSLKHHAGQYLL